MNGKQLKNSILQWAIQGKLVPQDPNDEPASVLLERIRAEKARLVKEGKIKKDKNESIIFRGEDNSHYEKFPDGRVACIDDEIPFEIPQGWGWARISSIFKTTSGGTPDKGHSDYYTNGNIPWLRSGELDRQYIIGTELMISQKGMENSSAKLFPVNTVAVAMYGATVGQASILKIETTTNQAICGLFPNNIVLPEFLYYFFLAKREDYLGMAFGSGQPNISQDVIKRTLIPIPPFEEQKKIAQQTDAIVALVQRYDASQAKLDKLNNEINDRLRKSILQEAIQGRLVPQDPNDEPASLLLDRIRTEKLKLLKEGTIKKKDIVDSAIFKGEDNKYYEKVDGKILDISEEISFEIPNSWQWIRLGTLFSHNTGKALNRADTDGIKKKYLTTSNVYWNRFDFNEVREMFFTNPELEKCTVHKGDLLVCEGGDIGRSAIWQYDEEICIQNHIHRLRAYYPINTEFYYLVFYHYKNIGNIGGKGIGIQGLSSGALHRLIVPLPPIEEQYRITHKYNSLIASTMRK